MELGARQRVGNGHADVVRQGAFHHADGLLHLLGCFAQVAELEEVPHADAVGLQPPGGLLDLGHGGALVHGVQDGLAAALGAHPHLLQPALGQRLDGVVLQQQVHPALHLVAQFQPPFAQHVAEALHPAGLQAEDVVGEPDVVRPVQALEQFQFVRHMFRRATVVAVAIDGLGAPVALEGTAARGGHVQREESLAFPPDGRVGPRVQQVPGRQGQCVQVAHHRGLRGRDHFTALPAHGAGHVLPVRAIGPALHELAQDVLALAQHHGLRAGVQVGLRMVGGIGAVHRHPAASGTSQVDHAQHGLAHHGEAHLGQVVETVVLHDQDVRLPAVERFPDLVRTVAEPGIEDLHFMAGLTQDRGQLQGAQGRVGASVAPLLGVQAVEVTGGGEHAGHRHCRGRPTRRSSSHSLPRSASSTRCWKLRGWCLLT